jgi:hypothetical protein
MSYGLGTKIPGSAFKQNERYVLGVEWPKYPTKRKSREVSPIIHDFVVSFGALSEN